MKQAVGKQLAWALGTPIALIVLLMLAVFTWPLIAPKPQYDFVYMTGAGYFSYQYYTIADGKVVLGNDMGAKAIPLAERAMIDEPPSVVPDLYYYDISENQSRPISFDEAQALAMINPDENDYLNKSPDGFVVESAGNTTTGLLGVFVNDIRSGKYDTYYIRGKGTSQELNLTLLEMDDYPRFELVGWMAAE